MALAPLPAAAATPVAVVVVLDDPARRAEVITTNLSEDASARLHEALSSGTVKTDVSDEESTITE